MDIIACILGSLWHNSCHVYRGRPQPQIAARDPVAASLSRGRQGQEEDPGESDRLAEAVDRRLPGPAEGRKGGRRRAGGGVDPPVVSAPARRRGAGNIAGDRLGPRPRTARQSPPRPGHRHGREPADRAGLEAGDGARARSGDRHLQPRRGAGLAGCRRRRELYGALDWLLQRQPAIEKSLARKHLADGVLVLYDVASSYLEGRCCPWPSSATTATARRASCRSSMACCAPPTAARWRSKCSTATPPIPRPWPPRSPSSRTASA